MPAAVAAAPRSPHMSRESSMTLESTSIVDSMNVMQRKQYEAYEEVLATCETQEKFAAEFCSFFHRTTDINRPRGDAVQESAFAKGCTNIEPMRWQDWLATMAAHLTMFFMFVSAVMSCVYPLVDGYLHGERHNAFQRFCLIGVSVCLVGIMALVPSTVRFVFYSFALREPINCAQVPAETVLKWITEYHTPTNAQILEVLLPSELLPFDVKTYLGEFLVDSDVDKGQLSLAECARLSAKSKAG